MASTYVFFLLFVSIFCQWSNSKSINITSMFNKTSTMIEGNETDQTNSFPITTTTAIVTTTMKLITTRQNSTTVTREKKLPSQRSHRWFLYVPLITLVLATSFGVFHYYRRQTPYRRFIQNWRSGDDDRDNIILELGQPEIIHNRWSPQISFN